MSTVRKELEFPAPPEGWEIDRYGTPVPGEKYWSSVLKWLDHDPALTYSPCYLVARKKQSPAEWANAQPDLAALARLLEPGITLRLTTDGDHVLQLLEGFLTIYKSGSPYGTLVVGTNLKWEDLQ